MFQQARGVLTGTFVITALCGSAQADEVADLLPFVPEDANAISVLRVDALKSSALGLEHNWAQEHETKFLEGAATVPPWVSTLVRASYVRPGASGGDWTAVVIPLPEDYDMQVLANREGTEVQEIDGHPAVMSARNNGYFIELTSELSTEHVLGGMMPATRQDVAHWARDVASDDVPRLSDYLATAVTDESAQIIMAYDMEHMLDPVQIRYRLEGAEALEEKDRERAVLTILFQTLKGVTFDIHVTDTMTADFHMEFGREVGPEGQYIKPLLIEFLNDAGAALDEVDLAQTTVRGRRVTLSMPLSEESLRRVLSLITTPPPPSEPKVAETTPSTTTPSEDETSVRRSHHYWDAVNQNIDDLRAAYSRASSYDRTAQWHENFARRIDQLNTRNVDEDLVEYGHWVADALRGLASSLRGTALDVDTLEKTIVYNVTEEPTYWRGPWGGYWNTGAYTAFGRWPYGPQPQVNITSNLQEVREKQAEAVQESAPERDKIWQMIDEERGATERKMVARYGDEFRE